LLGMRCMREDISARLASTPSATFCMSALAGTPAWRSTRATAWAGRWVCARSWVCARAQKPRAGVRFLAPQGPWLVRVVG
jgi:hypothetical protein